MPAGGNSRFRGYPARMSERQQLALLLQMTSQDVVSSGELPISRTKQFFNVSTNYIFLKLVNMIAKNDDKFSFDY